MIALLTLTLLAQDVVMSPRPVERVPPVYPSIGEMHGVLAKCAVIYDVLPDGSPNNICVVCNTSLPAFVPQSVSEFVNNEFVTEARAAVSQWRFETNPDGARQRVTGVEFMLENVETDNSLVWPAAPEPHQCPDSPIT